MWNQASKMTSLLQLNALLPVGEIPPSQLSVPHMSSKHALRGGYAVIVVDSLSLSFFNRCSQRSAWSNVRHQQGSTLQPCRSQASQTAIDAFPLNCSASEEPKMHDHSPGE